MAQLALPLDLEVRVDSGNLADRDSTGIQQVLQHAG